MANWIKTSDGELLNTRSIARIRVEQIGDDDCPDGFETGIYAHCLPCDPDTGRMTVIPLIELTPDTTDGLAYVLLDVMIEHLAKWETCDMDVVNAEFLNRFAKSAELGEPNG